MMIILYFPGIVLSQITVTLIAVISSVSVLLLSCIVFCIIGCACVRRRRRPNILLIISLDTTSPFQLSQHTDPVYEDVLPKSLSTNHKKDYDINENARLMVQSKECTYNDLHFLN